MELEYKHLPVVEVKTFEPSDTDPAGTFEALVSVFGNVDSYGDRMVKGAFDDSLSRRLPPQIWSHQWDVPPIGVTLAAEERDDGLYVKGRLFVAEDEDSPVARQVYTAMKAKDGRGEPALREFSFGYRVLDSEFVTEDGEEIREIKRVELYEVGPTLVGANPETQLVAIKARGTTPPTEAFPPEARVLSEEQKLRAWSLQHARPRI